MMPNDGSLFTGSLFDLRIYARAISPSEVVALSQPPLAGEARSRQTCSSKANARRGAGAAAHSLALALEVRRFCVPDSAKELWRLGVAAP
jgi:hypothetical protein